jgi:hypothetical protein
MRVTRTLPESSSCAAAETVQSLGRRIGKRTLRRKFPDPEKSPDLLPAPLPFEHTTVHDPDACCRGFVETRT